MAFKSQYYITDGTGSKELDVTSDSSYEQTQIAQDHVWHGFEVVFYNSSDEVVTPTAGDIVIQAALTDDLIYRDITNGTFSASTVYDTNRSIPIVQFMISAAKVSFTGITGADYAKVIIVSF